MRGPYDKTTAQGELGLRAPCLVRAPRLRRGDPGQSAAGSARTGEFHAVRRTRRRTATTRRVGRRASGSNGSVGYVRLLVSGSDAAARRGAAAAEPGRDPPRASRRRSSTTAGPTTGARSRSPSRGLGGPLALDTAAPAERRGRVQAALRAARGARRSRSTGCSRSRDFRRCSPASTRRTSSTGSSTAYDDYWRATALDEDFGRIDVPALHLGGWYDIFVTGTLANFRGPRADGRARRSSSSALGSTGPGARSADAGATRARPPSNDWQLRFFDEVAEGRASWRVRLAGHGVRPRRGLARPRRLAAVAIGRRRTATSTREAARTRSYGDGTLSSVPPGPSRPTSRLRPVDADAPARAGTRAARDARADGAADQDARALEGRARLHRRTRSSATSSCSATCGRRSAPRRAPSTPTSPRACASSTRCRLARRTSRRASSAPASATRSSAPSPLEPGRVDALPDLARPRRRRIPAGHRLRLDVSSSDFPQWDRQPQHRRRPRLWVTASAAVVATNAVYHDATTALPGYGCPSRGAARDLRLAHARRVIRVDVRRLARS